MWQPNAVAVIAATDLCAAVKRFCDTKLVTLCRLDLRLSSEFPQENRSLQVLALSEDPLMNSTRPRSGTLKQYQTLLLSKAG
jgi:hypothetical protein